MLQSCAWQCHAQIEKILCKVYRKPFPKVELPSDGLKGQWVCHPKNLSAVWITPCWGSWRGLHAARQIESLLLGDAPILPCYRKSSDCGFGSILGYCSTQIRLLLENDNRGLDLVFLYTLEKRVTSTVPSLSSFKWVLLYQENKMFWVWNCIFQRSSFNVCQE